MGQLIDFRLPPPPRDPDEIYAWEEVTRSLEKVAAVPSIKNILAAARAWEAWVLIAIPDEGSRRGPLS